MGRISRDYDTVKKRLMNKWGFSAFYAGNYAWSIERGTLSENSRQFKAMKRGRRKHVMEHYKDMGGKLKHPDFSKSGMPKEAVIRANSQLHDRVWEVDSTILSTQTNGVEKRSGWDEVHEYMKETVKEMRGKGYTLKVPLDRNIQDLTIEEKED